MLEASLKVKEEMVETVVKKPWISEEESQDVADKVDEFVKRVEQLVAEQEEAGLKSEPVFKMQKLSDDFSKVTKLFKKVAGKKKPVEKKPKKEKK